MISKRERVESVLQGRHPDRTPVSFWHHFTIDQITGDAAVAAHLELFERYDVDFVKVMNDHEYPRTGFELIATVEDLRRLKPLQGDEGELSAQLEVLRQLRRRIGEEVLTCTTLFNAWTWLRKMTAPIERRHGPPVLDAGEDPRDRVLTALLRQDRGAVKAAIATIGESLANFARLCVEAGAFGVFLSVRDDWVDTPANGADTYDEIVRPADLRILEAVRSAPFNVLHMCGKPMNFDRFNAYPVQVLNWADRSAGPSIASVRDRARPAIAGGVDNLRTLPSGTPEDCAAEVRDALRQAAGRPILITPGCTFDPAAVPSQNLRAMVAAARGRI